MFYSNLFEIEYKKKFPFVIVSKQNLFSIFFISLIIGVAAFIMESLLDYFSSDELLDRGFLVGPFIPLYFFVVFFLLCYVKTPMFSIFNCFKYFIFIALFITLVELIVGNVCEALFDVSLWKYEDSLPLSGKYISFTVSVIWGILGTFILFFIIPLLKKVSERISNKAKITILTLFLMIFISDCLVSIILVIQNNGYKELYGPFMANEDNTLNLISFSLYILCASSLILILNTSTIPNKKIVYILYFLSFLIPIVTHINNYVDYKTIFLNYLSYLGMLISITYFIVLLFITIKFFIKYVRFLHEKGSFTTKK